ncbi:uncharacterized protein TrAtP1_001347 [Trichoderma atroviride]|uniref:uncharacterized protein n=1 Tax=Hypocrea atroviridis TaxID=63577 RepID=UPI00331B8AB7|nr:hypothetical protein TrAtP1_001347 [Trichoderma atroviride]
MLVFASGDPETPVKSQTDPYGGIDRAVRRRGFIKSVEVLVEGGDLDADDGPASAWGVEDVIVVFSDGNKDAV